MEESVFVDRAEAAVELAKHEVRLEKFSGPLDLLLYLIRKDELEIADIPIAHVTRQYLDYLDIMHALDLEVAGDYILMAATLIRIKAQMLLPRPPVEGEEEDPRGRLVAALLEYRQFKEASSILHRYESDERLRYKAPGNMPARRLEESLTQNVNVWDLVTAMGEVLKRTRQDIEHEVVADPYTVEERIAWLKSLLETRDQLGLTDILGESPPRGLIVATFLALLELARLHMLTLEQRLPQGDIEIGRRQLTYAASALEGGE